MSTESPQRILVPVGESTTIRNTVAYVARKAAEIAEETGGTPEVHFVFPVGWQRRDLNAEAAEEATDLLERVRAWVTEDLDEEETADLPISVTTSVIGTEDFLFGPRDYAEVLVEYAADHGLEHIVLDPEYQPGSRAPLLTPLVAELERIGTISHEEAPVDRQIRGRQLLRQTATLKALVATFGLSFLFYQVIGGFAGPLDYATGAISAGIVAWVMSGITFEQEIRPARALRTGLRWLVYVPLLFWEVAKANVQVVYVVCHPSMPIDPSMEHFSPAVPLGLPVTTLANSITLTPGTVTVDIRGGEFHVHALTQSARDGLYGGRLERAVRFVFFGRSATSIASPRERGEFDEEDGQQDDGTEAEKA